MEDRKNDASVYIDALLATFKPAIAPPDTTHWFSTEEVHRAILAIDPGAELKKTDVFAAMRAAGFQFQNRPGSSGCDFRWMLTQKEDR